MTRMTRAEALRVLIDEAARAVAGSGCGIREELKPERVRKAADAIRRLWKEAYGYPCTDNDLRNRGVTP